MIIRSPRLLRVRTAFIFALFGAVTLALGLSLNWKILNSDNTAFLQQSIGDTSSLLALQVQLEVERLARELSDETRERIKPQVNHIKQENSHVRITARGGHSFGPALEAAAREIEVANTTGSVDVEPEISEISLWTVEDRQKPAELTYLAINPSFSQAAPQRLAKLKEREVLIRARIEPAFHGHLVVVSDPLPGLPKSLALIAIPLGHGEVNEVAAAHVSLEGVQKLFAMDSLAESQLVDRDGVILAHRDPKKVGRKDSESTGMLAPLYEHLAEKGGVRSGVVSMKDALGKPFYGGFRRVSSGGVSVISVVNSDQSESSLERVRRQVFLYVALVFVIMLVGALGYFNQVWPQVEARKPDPEPALSALPALPKVEAAPVSPRKIAAVAMHGSLRGFNQLLDGTGPEETTEALNDYLLSAAAIVRANGGRFEYYPGASFGVIWELKDGEGYIAISNAVRCGLLIRKEMVRLNESRKLDGKKALKQVIGLHVGQVLHARLGALPELRECVTGEALACARALGRVALAEDLDLVASQEVVESARGIFKGQCLGEQKLTPDTGLTAYYSVLSYQDDETLEVGRFDPGEQAGGGATPARQPTSERWLVNNGSQIVGPFSVADLSRMLYMQELDFDCECWHEETGRFSRLEIAGIFNGSQDKDAVFWVYDGELVHGPMSEGFVKTAAQRQAFGPNAAVCEKSTISGWRKISDFLTDRKAGTDSGGEAA